MSIVLTACSKGKRPYGANPAGRRQLTLHPFTGVTDLDVHSASRRVQRLICRMKLFYPSRKAFRVSKLLTPLQELRSLNMVSHLRVAGIRNGHRVSLGWVGLSECRPLIDKGFSTSLPRDARTVGPCPDPLEKQFAKTPSCRCALRLSSNLFHLLYPSACYVW